MPQYEYSDAKPKSRRAINYSGNSMTPYIFKKYLVLLLSTSMSLLLSAAASAQELKCPARAYEMRCMSPVPVVVTTWVPHIKKGDFDIAFDALRFEYHFERAGRESAIRPGTCRFKNRVVDGDEPTVLIAQNTYYKQDPIHQYAFEAVNDYLYECNKEVGCEFTVCVENRPGGELNEEENENNVRRRRPVESPPHERYFKVYSRAGVLIRRTPEDSD